jgi:nicotinamide mononucleotide transporter
MKRKVAAWPVGIFADAMLFTVFLGAVFAYSDNDANFYGQASRNLLLIFVSIYGWVRWAHYRRSGKGEQPAVAPRWTTTKEKLILVPTIIVFIVISMQTFKALGESGSWLLVDTWIFTGTALATFGMSRGYIEF